MAPKHHIFVCENDRPAGGRPACGARGRKVREALALAIARRPDLHGEVMVTGCDCLGPCFEGPNAVVYPDGTWYEGIKPLDAEPLVESHFVNGTPLARRVRPDVEED